MASRGKTFLKTRKRLNLATFGRLYNYEVLRCDVLSHASLRESVCQEPADDIANHLTSFSPPSPGRIGAREQRLYGPAAPQRQPDPTPVLRPVVQQMTPLAQRGRCGAGDRNGSGRRRDELPPGRPWSSGSAHPRPGDVACASATSLPAGAPPPQPLRIPRPRREWRLPSARRSPSRPTLSRLRPCSRRCARTRRSRCSCRPARGW